MAVATNVLASLASMTAVLILASGCGAGSGSSTSAGAAPKYGSEEFGLTDAELNARVEAVETDIASCMTAAGFEYVPVDAATVRRAMNADKTKAGISDEEYVAQYGFGITTIFEDPVADQGRGEKNTAILAGLTPADRVAYDRTLLGEVGRVGLARALEDEDLSNTGGCTRAALKRAFARDELDASYVNPGDVLLEQDPRMVAAIQDWAHCVRDKGYDYGHPDEVTDELSQRLAALLGGADPASLDQSGKAALADLQGEERAVAAVATACDEKEIVPVQDTVEAEIYGAPQS